MTQTRLYNSVNIKVPTPDGTLYLIVLEGEDGNAIGVDVSAGKCGNAFSAWARSTCDMISYMLETKAVPLPVIISLLSEHNTGTSKMTGNMTLIKSGPHGIKWGLLQYLQYKNRENESPFRTGSPRISAR